MQEKPNMDNDELYMRYLQWFEMNYNIVEAYSLGYKYGYEEQGVFELPQLSDKF